MDQMPSGNYIVPAQRERSLVSMSTSGREQTDLSDAVRRILAVLRRRWLVFVAIMAFAIGAAAFVTLRQPLQYTASASLLVNARILNIGTRDQAVIPGEASQPNARDTAMQVIQSDAVLRAVAELPEVTRRPDLHDDTRPQADTDANALIATIRRGLRVSRSGESNVINIAFTARDPLTAKTIADAVATQYVEVSASARRRAAGAADQGFRSELENLRLRVQEANDAVAQYRVANNLLSAEGKTLTEQEVSLYKQQDAQAKATLAEEAAKLATARRQLASGSTGDDVGEALNSTVIDGLRSQRAVASSQLAQLRAKYQPGHPDVVKSERQLADLDQTIKQEIGRVVSNLQARVEVAQSRASAANATTAAASGTLSLNNAAMARLGELELRAEAVRATYTSMMERRNAVASEALISDDDARLFSPASVPTSPSAPNKLLNMVLGVLLGLFGATLTLWLLHLFDRGIISSSDVERKLGINHLVNLPSAMSSAPSKDWKMPVIDFPFARPSSMISDAIRGLRLELERSSSQRPRRVIGITSSHPGEGKSTLAVQLARSFALAGQRTLLIDGDIRRPSVATMLGLDADRGLAELLTASPSIDDITAAFLRDPLTDLMILPSLPSTEASGEILSRAMTDLLASLRSRFDRIIIDTAPALAVAEARTLLQHADATVFVVQWNKTSKFSVRSALKKLEAVDVVPIGVVLTQVNMKALAAYGYGDVDQNYRAYKSYYN